jgi:PAS domain S-box-containing protein
MSSASPSLSTPLELENSRVLKAALNILEDIQSEKSSARAATQAVLNILEDLSVSKVNADKTSGAVLNILEDFDSERSASAQMNRAVLNILDDLEVETAKTRHLNSELEERVLERTAELSKSEQRFRLLVDGVKDYAIFMLDLKGNVLTWNNGAERLKGYQADEIIGQSFSKFYPPEDIANGKPQWELNRALTEGTFEENGVRVRKDGVRFTASVLITAVFDDKGEHVGYAKITRDITESKRAEERFRAAVELSPAAMIIVNHHGKVIVANALTEKLFGYRSEEILGQSADMLVPARQRSNSPEEASHCFEVHPPLWTGADRELFGLRKDGGEFPVEIGLNTIETNEGTFVFASISDISGRLSAQAEKLEAVRREVLLKEIHHRVKNNLAVISSLFYLQATYTTDEATRKLFQESQDRVRSMALVHEKLYRSETVGSVEFGDYAADLTQQLMQAYSVSEKVRVTMNLEPISFNIDLAVPCGLILNELISNALKHAFRVRRHGEIRIELHKLGANTCSLSVTDDGDGIPLNLDIEQSRSLGLRLIKSLVKQIDGRFEMTRRNPGTEARVTLEMNL